MLPLLAPRTQFVFKHCREQSLHTVTRSSRTMANIISFLLLSSSLLRCIDSEAQIINKSTKHADLLVEAVNSSAYLNEALVDYVRKMLSSVDCYFLQFFVEDSVSPVLADTIIGSVSHGSSNPIVVTK